MELKKVFEERRSVNYFDSSREIEENILKEIIELAVLAPSAFNLQPWKIVAVKSKEAKERLMKLASNQPKIVEAPVTLIIAGDKKGFEADNPEWELLEKIVGSKEVVANYQGFASMLYGTSEERKIKFAESNASLLAMSIMYAAKEHGVDTHPMSGIDFEGIVKEFGLEERYSVVMLIALGYFDSSKELYPRRARKGYNEIVEEI